MWQALVVVLAPLPFLVSAYSGDYAPVTYSHSYASPSGNTFGYSYASAGSSAGGSPSYGGRTYTSGYSEPYSSYYSSSSDSSGGRPYSSYSSYSSHCAYENDVVIENGISRPMTDRERQLVRNYEREIMNYNQRSAAAIFNMNLRFMEQIRDGQFPTLYPYEMNQMPQPPCLCSSCRRGYSSSSYHYEK